ncbi:M protein repeat protein [Trichuris suis]|nr:M protein repeat protein [Trichuris suis]
MSAGSPSKNQQASEDASTAAGRDVASVGAVLKHVMPVGMLNAHYALAINELESMVHCAQLNQERLKCFLDTLYSSGDEVTVGCAVDVPTNESRGYEALTNMREEIKRVLIAVGVKPAPPPAVPINLSRSSQISPEDYEEEYLRMLFTQLIDELVIESSNMRNNDDGFSSDLITREKAVINLTTGSADKDVEDDKEFECQLKTTNNTLKELVSTCNKVLQLPSAASLPDPDPELGTNYLCGWPLDLTHIKLKNDITLDDYLLGMHGCVVSAQMTDVELEDLMKVAKTSLEKADIMDKQLLDFKEIVKVATDEFRELLANYGNSAAIPTKDKLPPDVVTQFDQLTAPVIEATVKLANELHRDNTFIKNCDVEAKSTDEYLEIIREEGNLRLNDAMEEAAVVQERHALLEKAIEDKRADIMRLQEVEKRLQDTIREGMISPKIPVEQRANIPVETKQMNLQRKIEDVKQEKMNIMDSRRALEERIKKLHEELAEVEREGEQKIAELNKELEKAQSALEVVTKQLESVQMVNEEMCKQLEKLDQERVLRETTLRQCQVRNDLEARLAERRLLEATDKHKTLMDKKAYLEKELVSVQEQLKSLEAEKEKEAATEKELDKQLANLQEELSRSRSENRLAVDLTCSLAGVQISDRSTKAIEEIVRSCNSKDDAAIRLGLEISRYSRQNEFYAAEVERNKQIIASLNARAQQLEARYATLCEAKRRSRKPDAQKQM